MLIFQTKMKIKNDQSTIKQIEFFTYIYRFLLVDNRFFPLEATQKVLLLISIDVKTCPYTQKKNATTAQGHSAISRDGGSTPTVRQTHWPHARLPWEKVVWRYVRHQMVGWPPPQEIFCWCDISCYFVVFVCIDAFRLYSSFESLFITVLFIICQYVSMY